MTARFLSGAAALALLPGLAWGQATPQGAADLTALFQTYLGATPGVVNVVPEGGAYAVTLDATPFIGMIPAEAGVTMSMTPQRMLLTDNGDGTWAVVQDQPVSFKLSVPGAIEMSVDVAKVACTGVFDAGLKAFAKNDCVLDGVVVDQTVTDPMAGTQVTKSTLTQMLWSSANTAGANGGVDGSLTYSATGISQTMDMPMQPGMPPVTITLAMDGYQVDGVQKGVRTEAFLAALAWVVSNPSQAAMLTNRGALKGIIEGGLPLFDEITATGTGTNLVVGTPVGPISAQGLSFDIALRGAVEDGLFREAIRLSGVTPPPGVLPPFVEPLIPTDATIDFAVESFDAKATAGLLLGLFDLAPGASPPEGFDAEVLSALMPDGSVDIVLHPGEVRNATYTLTWDGRMQAGPNMMPVGSGTVTAKGWNEVMALVSAMPPEMQTQIAPVMGMAQGLAQPGPDGSLLWELDATVPGTFKVNGMDLMGMQ